MKKSLWLLFICLLLCIFSLSIGASDFSWQALFEGDQAMNLVFWQSRLPRTLSILLAASSMSVAGLLMQAITQNSFAAPSTIGTVEAAKLGLLLSLFIFPNTSLQQKVMMAFLVSMAVTLFFISFAKRFALKEQWMLPLLGLVFSGIIGSFSSIIAYRYNLVQSMSSWTQGSFSMIQSGQYEWLFLGLVILVIVAISAERFTIISLGKDISNSLGLSYDFYEKLALLLVALTTSVTIITVGSLPFLGVIVPNIVRRFKGDHLKQSIFSVALTGMNLVLLCDIIGRLVIRPYEVSVSLVLGIIGSIVFIGLLWKGSSGHAKEI
ncbi:ABC transporter permease [Granulicatella seriolae]|uniref:Iron chelate uptake ABC transporter family permease subunit n=1 Tax=Granulicatella seriolae TaxID=2967226 RepID=A0ABT1WNJ1_9LACT|nr:iron chelate uptake ABC transporter family permease subunit [Granulicatella seriolae]